MSMRSRKPKVMATGIGGAVGTIAAWVWNTGFDETKWVLEDFQVGIVVTIVAFFAGPVLRKYQEWADN